MQLISLDSDSDGEEQIQSMRHESKIVEESAVPAKIKALYFAMAHKVGVQAGAGGARDTWVLQRMYYVP
jgi:hypothetical protein